VDLVDDDAVHVSDEGVPPGVVLARRAVGLLGRRHEHVRALGTAGLRSRSPETTYTGVAEILEPLPLALLLIGERAERRDEERSPAL